MGLGFKFGLGLGLGFGLEQRVPHLAAERCMRGVGLLPLIKGREEGRARQARRGGDGEHRIDAAEHCACRRMAACVCVPRRRVGACACVRLQAYVRVGLQRRIAP